MRLLFILLSILQFVSPTSSLPPLYLGPQLLSARLYLLKELPFPLFASRLPFHSYSSSLQVRMLGYYVFLFWSFARVSLFFVLCSAVIYSSCFLARAFTPMEWSVPVNDFMSWPHLCYFALCIIHLRARAALVCVCRLWVPVWGASCTTYAIVFRVDRRTALPSHQAIFRLTSLSVEAEIPFINPF